MTTLDYSLLRDVQRGFQKKSFVPMPGGQTQAGGAEPVAGASPMTAGMGAPVGGAPQGAMGPDPAAMQQLMQDPAMLQQLMQDPAMAEQMGIDPAMLQQLASGMGDPAMMGVDPSTGAAMGAPMPGEEGAPAEGGAPADSAGAPAGGDPIAELNAKVDGLSKDINQVLGAVQAFTKMKIDGTGANSEPKPKTEDEDAAAGKDELLMQVTRLADLLEQSIGQGM